MLGAAAVAIWCDVALEVKDEYDDWHAHEHMPERPGSLSRIYRLAYTLSTGRS